MPIDNTQSKLDIPSPERNLFVGTTQYPTVVSAVTAAELLAGAATSDTEGVTVHVPAGFWNEDVTIRKHVNIRGEGKNSSRLAGLIYRPTSAVAGPTRARVSNIRLDSLDITNETAIASGIYFPTMMSSTHGFEAIECKIDALYIENSFAHRFILCDLGDDGATELPIFNIDNVRLLHCWLINPIANYMDIDDPGSPVVGGGSPVFTGSLLLDHCTTFSAVTCSTVNYDNFNYSGLSSENSYLTSVVIGADCAYGIVGGTVDSKTIDPGAQAGFSYFTKAPYTPVVSGDWPVSPSDGDDALDKLAARTEALENASDVSDGDKGDITVSASGATWTIDNGVVTNAKAASMATKTYKGRTSVGTGVSEDVAVATLKTDLGLVKADVGLGNVDNTSDANKPVSTATQTALDLKAPLASPTFTGTVSGINKSMVGLGNVDNTSDASKPVSTAQQTALDLKANIASPTFTGTVGGITKSMVGLGNVDNTSDANKPVSTATQNALDLKKTDSMATNKLLGRGTASTGVIEEITLGTNLSFTGTTLNAAGGSGGQATALIISSLRG